MGTVRYGYAPTLSSWGAAAPQPSAWTVTTSRRTAPSDGIQRSHRHAFLVCDRGSRVGDEYLTVSEVASLLKVSPKRVRNMMSGGTFQPGDHFFRRPGIGPRFLRSRVENWLRNGCAVPAEAIPMARRGREEFGRRPREDA